MKKYCDYNFYVNEYNGTMAEEDFNREVLKASAYVDMVTMNRITASVLNKYTDQIKLATCAACDVYYAAEKGGEVTSETVGSWSRSYGASGMTVQQKLQDSVENYLVMTGLLYRGSVL
jgi:hypothetical protein|nr:MAG TPA: Head Tail Connector Protein [Caudoviricetes sp.]